METGPALRNSTERKGEPEIDLVGPVYSNRTGIIARGPVLLVKVTSPELRPADARKPGMLEVRKLVEIGLGAPVSSMHAGGASGAPTKDLFLQRCRAIEPLLAATLEGPAWPAEVRAAQSSDSNAVESDIFSVSSVCADWQPHCAAPAWHVEPRHALRHALTDELNKTDKPPADPPADERSIELPSPFHFPSTSGTSSSAPGRARQRGHLLAALFLLLGACWCGVLLSTLAPRPLQVRTRHPATAEGRLALDYGEPPGCWAASGKAQGSLPIPARWSKTEAVPMPLPAPPKTEVAEEHRSETDTAGSSPWPLLMSALMGCLGFSAVALKWSGSSASKTSPGKVDGQKRSRRFKENEFMALTGSTQIFFYFFSFVAMVGLCGVAYEQFTRGRGAAGQARRLGETGAGALRLGRVASIEPTAAHVRVAAAALLVASERPFASQSRAHGGSLAPALGRRRARGDQRHRPVQAACPP